MILSPICNLTHGQAKAILCPDPRPGLGSSHFVLARFFSSVLLFVYFSGRVPLLK